jgi:MraZ protein
MDVKGRIAVPSRFRESVLERSMGKVVLTIDIEERCLLLYLLPDWEQIEEKLAALPSFNKAARRIQRLIIGHATELEMDANGRLNVPSPLRSYAELEKRLLLVGQGHKFELWSEARWNASREQWLVEAMEEVLPEELQTISL